MRVAAVDCGTNTLKLLVADLDPATGAQRDVLRTERVVRLGAGVDRTGEIAPEAMARTLGACAEYAAALRELGAEQVVAAATSATRDARNGAELVDGIAALLGVPPDVVDGEAEARLSYAGAVRGLGSHLDHSVRGLGPHLDHSVRGLGPHLDHAVRGLGPHLDHAVRGLGPHLDHAVLLVDVGGGSTELVRGRGSLVEAAASADVGSVRLTERHLADDPPSPGQVAAARADVVAALDALPVRLTDVAAVVPVSGTAVTVAAHALALDALGAAELAGLHGARLDPSRVRSSCADLLGAAVADRRAMGFMHPDRADVIGGGAVVLDQVLARTGAATVVPSTHDLLDGLAWTLLDPR